MSSVLNTKLSKESNDVYENLKKSIKDALKNKKVSILKEVFDKQKSLNLTDADGDDAILIASALKHNVSVEKIRFASQIGDFGAKAIGELLTSNKKIRDLEFFNCNITQTGMKLLAEGVGKNTSLTSLNIIGINPIGNQGMIHLCSSLTNHESIKKICIYNEAIKKNGWISFGETLPTMSKLISLELGDHDFSEPEILESIMKAFHKTSIVKKLFLRKNKITAQSVLAISKMLSLNKSLEYFEFWADPSDDKFNKDIVDNILLKLQNNHTLKEVVIVCNLEISSEIKEQGLKLTNHHCDIRVNDYKIPATKVSQKNP